MGLVERFELRMSIIGIMWIGLLMVVSSAYKFYVGGRDGWVITPSEDYTHWSHRNRFRVNDTLYFRYKKGSDSVMEVKEEDYKECNTKSPITRSSSNEGEWVFVLGRSGPFFIITGNSTNCFRGQKLSVVVMSLHHHHSSSPPSPAAVSPTPSPANSPPDSEARAPAPAPMSARNSGSKVVACSLGWVLMIVMSCMVYY